MFTDIHGMIYGFNCIKWDFLGFSMALRDINGMINMDFSGIEWDPKSSSHLKGDMHGWSMGFNGNMISDV